MSNGVLGTKNLIARRAYSLATCDFTTGESSVTVNFTNRNDFDITVSLAITDNMHEIDDLSRYIEYETTVPANGSLERTGILVYKNTFVTVWSNSDNVSAQCWGYQQGTDNSTPPLFAAADPDLIVNGTPNELYLGRPSTSLGTVTYTLSSGSLPAGMTLSSNGTATGTPSTAGFDPSGVTSTATIQAVNDTYTASRTFSIRRVWANGTTADLAALDATVATQYNSSLTTPTQIWIDPDDTNRPFQIYAAENIAALATVPAGTLKPSWVDNVSGLNIISRSVIDQTDTMLISIDDYHRLVNGRFGTVAAGSTPYFYWIVTNSSSGQLIGVTRTRFYNTTFEGWRDHHTGDNPATLTPNGGTITPEWSVWGTTNLPSGTEYVITNDTSNHVRSIPYRSVAPTYNDTSVGLHYKRTADGEHYPWRDLDDVTTQEGYFFTSATNNFTGVPNIVSYIAISTT